MIIEEHTGRNVAVSYDEKDACLIAAATDLLEACKWVIDRVGEFGNLDTVRDDEVIEALRTAISKAEEENLPVDKTGENQNTGILEMNTNGMTPKEIKKDIRASIKLFGEYNFFDKLLFETIDVTKYRTRFVAIGAKDTADLLEGILKEDKKYGEHFVEGMLMELQDEPEEFWNELMSRPALRERF